MNDSFKRNFIVTVVHRIKETLMRFRYYKFSLFRKNKQQFYISIFDEKRTGFGLADRFKGMISLYAFCKIKNIPFRNTFTYPFDFLQFIEPNKYDWRLKDGERSSYSSDVRVLIVQGEDSPWRLTWLKTKKQTHTYINRDYLPIFNRKYGTLFDWGELFHELFKPAPKLEMEINRHLSIIHSSYIACQLRFMALLGDFKEYNNLPLHEKEQQVLINQCTGIILDLKKQCEKPILVVSDSIIFLQHISQFEGIITFPDKTVHIDCVGNEDDSVYMKPFIDFLLLSKADKIYNIVVGEMYPSEFPLYAAKINNIPFERINKTTV